MLKVALVAIHEVRIYLQDKGDLAFSLLLPVVTFALMYGAFGGQTTFNGTAHVVNQDPAGSYSARLVEELGELDGVDVELLSAADADRKLERSDLLMVVYIPEGFSDKLAAGEQTELLFRQRGNGGQEGQIVAALARGVAERMNQEFSVLGQTSSSLAGKGIPQEDIEATTRELLAREQEQPLVAVTHETVGSSPDLVNQFLPGIVTMYVLFAITLGAQAIVQERRLGTLERLLTTRLSVGQLFFGKFLAGISRGFLQTLVLLVLSYIVFQMFTPLSFIESLVIALIFAAAAGALGLVIAAIARTEDQATWIAVFFTMSMVMISGTFFEIAEGSVFHTISKVSINTYANTALKTVIAEGGSLADVGFELAALAGVAVVGLALSRVLFKVMPGGR